MNEDKNEDEDVSEDKNEVEDKNEDVSEDKNEVEPVNEDKNEDEDKDKPGMICCPYECQDVDKEHKLQVVQEIKC